MYKEYGDTQKRQSRTPTPDKVLNVLTYGSPLLPSHTGVTSFLKNSQLFGPLYRLTCFLMTVCSVHCRDCGTTLCLKERATLL